MLCFARNQAAKQSPAKKRKQCKAQQSKAKRNERSNTKRDGDPRRPPRNQASKANPSKETSKTIRNETGAQGEPLQEPGLGTRSRPDASPFAPQKKGFFLPKSFYLSPSPLDFDYESETSLRYLQKLRPIPRLRRVLNRETRCFESETRDSGNSAP